MYKALRLFFLLAVLSLSATAFAQFPANVDGFISEAQKKFSEAKKKEGKAYIELTFAPFFRGPGLSEEARKRFYSISNSMLKKRMGAYPHLEAFFTTTMALAERTADLDGYYTSLEWAIKKGRKKNIDLLLNASKTLAKRGVLYESTSTLWRKRNGNYTIVFDSVPKFIFKEITLLCEAKGDSAVIQNTSGTFYPVTSMFYGNGGGIDWRRAGLDKAKTFAVWQSGYKVKMKSSSFVIDSVSFTDPYFDTPLLGTITDKVLANVTPEKAIYPRFESYDKRKQIKNIEPGVDFEGGFSLKGAALQGYGTAEQPATLVFHREGKPFIVTRSLYYVIEPSRIASDDVSAVMYLDKDSVYHPSTSLKLMREKKQLSLIKKQEGISSGPFFNTYHDLDMYFNALTWKLGDPVIAFGNLYGSSETRASFESYNYFKEKRYYALMGMDQVHPLARLNDKFKSSGEVFTAQEFAVSARLQKAEVIPMIMNLATKGYIDYNIETELITVRPRMREHILNSAEKLDYDVIQFNSNIDDGRNAVLNLLNNDLTVKGVSRIVLSDSQDVRIFPEDGNVIIKEGRDFQFGGVIQAGRLQFYGTEYFFHYEPFNIDLIQVDSVSFYAESFESDDEGYRRLVRVKNVIEEISGTLEIDEPSNKSGLWGKDYPIYPRFNNVQDSYVYYDNGKIQKGAYGRDKFYFQTEPFVIDSLDNFSNEGIYFPGTLVSAGIFADIEEPLRLQQDYSLGFVRGTGGSGMGLYGKGSKFTDQITLNFNGLQGEGDLEYLTTTASSKQFVFCPDSTFGMADTLVNLGSTSPSKVAQVNGSGVDVKFVPSANSLTADFRKKPMVMYDDEALLYGSTELTPAGLTGAGLVDFRNATLFSKDFDFETRKVLCDTGDFKLTEGDTASIAFATSNVNATIDLDERYGDFVSNGDETVVEFPVNKYICYMDRFKWFMDDGDIQLESDRTSAAGSGDLNLAGPNFISIHPDQDSLSFMAPKARYNLKKHIITATDVEYIPVADALIYPDSSLLRIYRNARIDKLKNSAIVANFVTKYHNIYNAEVEIKAKRKYQGVGDIDYVDETKRTQTIFLEKITVDTSYQTEAYGKISETAAFQLSPHFDYYGDVNLSSREKFLKFTGNVRILHECDNLDRNWMGFSAQVDPKEIYIPVGDTLKNGIGRAIGAGVRMTDDDPFELYGTFLSEIKEKEDRPVIMANGLLHFDKKSQEYRISNKEKLKQRNLPGNYISLNVKNCHFEGDGNISMAVEVGQVNLTNVGSVLHLPDSGKTTTSTVTKVDFFFHDQALNRMVEEILIHPDAVPMKIADSNYDAYLREQLGLEKSDKLISELSIKGELKKLPEEVRGSIVFGDIKMIWNEDEEQWESQGKLSIASVGKKAVFREIGGKVIYRRKRGGDELFLFLGVNENMYYYFNYYRNYMYAYSSDDEFNKSIMELKEDKRVADTKKKEAPYRFMIGTKAKTNKFRDEYDL